MSKHTPGPWKSSPSGKYIFGDIDNLGNDGDSPLVVEIFTGDFEPQKSVELNEEQLSNSKLITAAPDLLECCKVALDILSDNGYRNTDYYKWFSETVIKATEGENDE